MSIAAPQFRKFSEETVRTGKVFTFTENQGYLVYLVYKVEVVPFWSSRSRLEKIQGYLPKYLAFQITEIAFQTFYDWLAEAEKDNLQIGVNWSGKTLKGYNVRVAFLRKWLDYRIDESQK